MQDLDLQEDLGMQMGDAMLQSSQRVSWVRIIWRGRLVEEVSLDGFWEKKDYEENLKEVVPLQSAKTSLYRSPNLPFHHQLSAHIADKKVVYDVCANHVVGFRLLER